PVVAVGFPCWLCRLTARKPGGQKRSESVGVFFQEFFMAEGYCVKCKAKKEIVDAVEELMTTGRKAIKGKCPTCGTVMFKILGGKAAPKSEPAPEVPPS